MHSTVTSSVTIRLFIKSSGDLSIYCSAIQRLRRSTPHTTYSACGIAPGATCAGAFQPRPAACQLPAKEAWGSDLRGLLTQARHLGLHPVQAGKLRAERHPSAAFPTP